MVGGAVLVIHIIAGSVALATAAVALITAKGGVHHIRAGRVYAAAMALVCVSALPLAVLGSDVVLLLVAVFSSYLVFAGWRFARNRSGGPQVVDWAALAAMGLTGLGMWGYGATLFLRGEAQWVPMAVFGAIAVALSAVDLRYHRARQSGQRIARHLTNMLAGTIATVTAVVVVISPTCWQGPSPPLLPWWWSTWKPTRHGWRGFSPPSSSHP